MNILTIKTLEKKEAFTAKTLHYRFKESDFNIILLVNYVDNGLKDKSNSSNVKSNSSNVKYSKYKFN